MPTDWEGTWYSTTTTTAGTGTWAINEETLQALRDFRVEMGFRSPDRTLKQKVDKREII